MFIHETSSSSLIFKLLTRYYETEPTKMIAYLSDRYSLSFPQNINNIRTAKVANDASGNYSFVMKFQNQSFYPTIADNFIYT